ncbi:MAG: hypothetical protein P4L69_08770 [Desulfosporosinus sp.]|nr:hypothetical protein [Desulfosporosinus sp.]
MINTAMFFFVVSTALYTIAGSLTEMIIYRALAGVFAAAVMPISQSYVYRSDHDRLWYCRPYRRSYKRQTGRPSGSEEGINNGFNLCFFS